MNVYHKPVMLSESLDLLVVKKNGIYFDGTLGFGGHSEGILKALDEDGRLIATDVDLEAFNYSKEKFKDDGRVSFYNTNFSQIDLVAKIEPVSGFDGIFADLGVSSFQLDNSESGFTYRAEAPLDLRMDKKIAVSAAEVVNTFSEEEIADIIYKFGEERNSRLIAKRICEKRNIKKITTTFDLSSIVESVTPKNFQKKSLSRVFQAFRIYVNDELGVLQSFLNKSIDLLNPEGRIVILTYHSLEDRIVKETFKYEALGCICPKDFPVCMCDKKKRLNILTKRPEIPSEEEIKENYRSRSAKLRGAEKVEEER
jgi:16S rRNA (cytosine1402-N4)-methyltransferase